MAGENGTYSDALIDRFDDQVLECQAFFPLVALVERICPTAPPIGSTDAPGQELIRFRANPSLGFPAREVSEVSTADGKLNVYVNILGLHGPSSPLPPSYTERIVHAEGTGALGDFLDFFNHRLLSLLVAIWKHYRHDIRYVPGAGDPISLAIGALFGLPPGCDSEQDRERRVRLLPYAGLLALHSRSADLIASLISHHLGFRCSIEEFIPREIDIPDDARWRLGGAISTLGEDIVLGDRIPDVAGKFRVRLGPLAYDEFRSVLPDREAHSALRDLIGFTVRDPLAWDLALQLAPGEAPAWILGQNEIGWTTLLEPAGDAGVEVLL